MKKILYTFFFGFAAYKYRRLIRTPIILTAFIFFFGNIYYNFKPSFEDETYYIIDGTGEKISESDALERFDSNFDDLVNEDETYYIIDGSGEKISESDALERFDSDFDELVNQGVLVEYNESDDINGNTSFNADSNFYQTPNGKFFSEGYLINRYGREDFDNSLRNGNIKKVIDLSLLKQVTTSPTLHSNISFFVKMNELFIVMNGVILLGFLVVGLISYLLEPFFSKDKSIARDISPKTELKSNEDSLKVISHKSKSSNKFLSKIKFFFIYFILFWIQASIIVVISFIVIGPRPSGLIALGGLISFWSSYKLTRLIMPRISKSL